MLSVQPRSATATPSKSIPKATSSASPKAPTDTLPSTSTASKPDTPKKKSAKKDVNSRGLKWFKKSHKKSSMKLKLLKCAQREGSPVMATPIPPRVVEFEIDGTYERIGVLEPLEMIDKCSEFEIDLALTPSLDWHDDTTNTSFPSSPLPAGISSKKGKCGKGKGTLKPKSTGSQKKGSRVTNGDLPTASTSTSNDSGPGTSQSISGSSLHVKLPEAQFRIMEDFEPVDAPPRPNAYIRYMETPQEELADEVEYDLDEEDFAWLELVNEKRREHKLPDVHADDMEFLLDRLEKESYFQMQSTGMDQSPPIDDDAVCCICMDGECQNSNAILFCDMCNLAVHQECYGVPYIPEGQWLCRRCLQSPSRAVDCVLCPNKCGAFKQTDDGRWAHVVCALWIPEVCFSNPVFLEPVDSVGNIPAARWRLTCFICKQKGVGACIQCYKSNCYTAFHVTCAQQANLCMKMDTVRDSTSVIVKKTAYCDNHAPPELLLERKRKEGTADDSSPRQKMKQTRKLLAEKRDAIPLVSIPTIPPERVAEISVHVSFPTKKQFMKRLMAYWKLKRQARNGVPLLRRLQASSLLPSGGSNKFSGAPTEPTDAEASFNYYKYWLRLRQDLERARLLCELIRKREKVKRQIIHFNHRASDLTLRPLNMIYLNVLDELRVRDPQDIFFDPVDTTEVTDYLTIVTEPMDISTMREKVNSYQYNSIDDLEKDFNLMISNCLSYNQKDTVFYKAGVRLRELGGIIIRQARRAIESIGFDKTGFHLQKRSFVAQELTDAQILEDIEELLEDEDRFDLSFDEHIEKLQEILDKSLSLTHTLTRKKKVNRIKQEIFRIRRLKAVKENSGSAHKKYKAALASATKKPNMNLSCVNMSDSDSVEAHPSPRKRRSLKADLNLRTPLRRTIRASVKTAPNLKSGRELRPLRRKVLEQISEEPAADTLSPTKPRVRSLRKAITPTTTPLKARETRVLRRNSVSVSSSLSVPIPLSHPGKPLFTTIPNPVEYPTVEPMGMGFDAWKRNESPDTPVKIPTRASKIKKSVIPVVGRKERNPEELTPVKPKPVNIHKNKDNIICQPVTEITPTKKTKAPPAISSSKKTPNSNSRPNLTNSIPVTKNSVARNEQRKSSTRSPSPRRSAPTKGKTLPEAGSQERVAQMALDKTTQDIVEGLRTVRPSPPNRSVTGSKKSKNPVKNTSQNSKKNSNPSPIKLTQTSPPTSAKKSPTRSPSPRRSLISALAKVQASQDGASSSDYEPWVPELSTCPHSHTNNVVEKGINNNVNNIRKGASPRKKKEPVSNARHMPPANSRGPPNPDSFMTYRSGGGDGVNSNSNSEAEDEEGENRSAEVSSSSDTSSSSASSVADPEEVNNHLNSSDSEVESEEEPLQSASVVGYSSSEDEEEVVKKSSESSSSSSSSSSSTSSSSSSSSSTTSFSSDAVLHQSKHTTVAVEPKERRNGTSSVKERERVSRPVLTARRKRPTQPSEPESSPESRQVHQAVVRQERLEDSDDGSVEPLSFNRTGYGPKVMDLVWTRVKESSWYPALICRPSANGWSKNGVTIPGPPPEILAQKPKDSALETFLVLFFDTQRTWEWVEASRLEPLGQNPSVDKQHLDSIKLPEKKTVRKAYERAILHKGKVTGQPQLV